MTPNPYIVGAALCGIAVLLAGVLAIYKARKEGKQPLLKRIGTMNLILIITFVSMLAFVVKMIQLFEEYGTIPDTLVTCFFAVCGGECGIMGWIKTAKERNRDRKWEIQDRQELSTHSQSEEMTND